MFEFFWVRAASTWITALYVLMGALLLLFPGVSSTLFVWSLAIGAGAYGASHLWRYLQERKSQRANPGDLFLAVLPAAFAAFVLIWPRVILSILPLALGLLLLVDGVGKLPLAVTALREQYPSMIPLTLASVLPIILGLLIIVNPFTTVRIVIMVFGASLIADGASDFATLFMERRASSKAA